MTKNNKGILLLTIDCGRKDLVYGAEVDTPNIDALRGEAMTFHNAFSQSSTTLPSLYSLFLSQYLTSHGVLSNAHYKDLRETSLPHLLAEQGWDCRSFTGFDLLHQTFGKDFKERRLEKERMISRRWKRKIKAKAPSFLAAAIERSAFKRHRIPAQQLIEDALTYLRSVQSKAFLWLHFFDAHMEYYAPQKWIEHYYSLPPKLPNKSVYNQLRQEGIWFPENSFGSLLKVIRDPRYYLALYKAALSHIDEQLGLLFDEMKKMGLYDRFVIILSSDHGENLLNHGMYCSHFQLFPTTTNVPLIIKCPDFAQKELDDLVQHIDLFPTICEIFKVDLPPTIEGKSILPLITQGKSVNAHVYSEHMRLLQKMVASKEWFYIFSDHQQEEWHGLKFEERYLIRRKNGHTKNLSNRFKEVCNQLENIALAAAGNGIAAPEDRNAELEERLRALGYL